MKYGKINRLSSTVETAIIMNNANNLGLVLSYLVISLVLPCDTVKDVKWKSTNSIGIRLVQQTAQQTFRCIIYNCGCRKQVHTGRGCIVGHMNLITID